MILLRRELGDVLREHRQSQGRTLPLSEMLGHVSERVAETEALTAPVTLPVPNTALVSASAA